MGRLHFVWTHKSIKQRPNPLHGHSLMVPSRIEGNHFFYFLWPRSFCCLIPFKVDSLGFFFVHYFWRVSKVVRKRGWLFIVANSLFCLTSDDQQRSRACCIDTHTWSATALHSCPAFWKIKEAMGQPSSTSQSILFLPSYSSRLFFLPLLFAQSISWYMMLETNRIAHGTQ